MLKVGFDNDKYLEMQSAKILERVSLFDNKLYLEFGGKLFDDYHAGRLTENMLDEFLEWIAAQKGRVFVNIKKFQMYFGALRECLRTGKKWWHFNLDWEDEYIRKQAKLIF